MAKAKPPATGATTGSPAFRNIAAGLEDAIAYTIDLHNRARGGTCREPRK